MITCAFCGNAYTPEPDIDGCPWCLMPSDPGVATSIGLLSERDLTPAQRHDLETVLQELSIEGLIGLNLGIELRALRRLGDDPTVARFAVVDDCADVVGFLSGHFKSSKQDRRLTDVDIVSVLGLLGIRRSRRKEHFASAAVRDFAFLAHRACGATHLWAQLDKLGDDDQRASRQKAFEAIGFDFEGGDGLLDIRALLHSS